MAYPYVAKRLLTDRDASLRGGWCKCFSNRGVSVAEIENLTRSRESGGGLDLTDTVADGAQLP